MYMNLHLRSTNSRINESLVNLMLKISVSNTSGYSIHIHALQIQIGLLSSSYSSHVRSINSPWNKVYLLTGIDIQAKPLRKSSFVKLALEIFQISDKYQDGRNQTWKLKILQYKEFKIIRWKWVSTSDHKICYAFQELSNAHICHSEVIKGCLVGRSCAGGFGEISNAVLKVGITNTPAPMRSLKAKIWTASDMLLKISDNLKF